MNHKVEMLEWLGMDDWDLAAQNRVTPLEDIEAFPLGPFPGNRGRLP